MGMPAAADAQPDFGRLIHALSHHLRRRSPVSEGGGELTHMQRHILFYILMESMNREIYQKDVEEEFHIRRSTATGMLQLMEKSGFITRESVPQDARLKKIVPTKKAGRFRTQVQANIARMEQKLADGIPPQDLDTCREVLLHMLGNLTQNDRRTDNEQGGNDE